MKKIIITIGLALVTVALAIGYERYFVRKQFGPSSLIGVVIPFLAGVTLIITHFLLTTRWRNAAIQTWLVAISVVSTFAVVDLVAGVFLVKPLSPMLEVDSVRHHKLIPHTDSRIEQPEFSYIQHVNNLGLRGKDTSLKKPASHYRILMLGDSFTMGKGVEDDQTFSALLNTSFNQQGRCRSTVEVLNGGVDSYAPILSFLQLSKDLAGLEVDLVLLNLDLSDLLQETVYRKEAVYNGEGEIVGVPGRTRPTLLSEQIRFWIDQHTFFTRLLLFYFNKWLGYKDFTVQGMVARVNPDLLKYTLTDDQVDYIDQWDRIFDSIAKIKRFVEERKGAFALVVYPWGHQVHETEWVPGRYNWIPQGAIASDKYLDTIFAYARDLGIEVINQFPAFRSYKGVDPLYFKQDMHWTVEGHRVMASALQEYLERTHLSAVCGTKSPAVMAHH